MTEESLGQLVLRSMSDPQLFGSHFQPEASWRAWQTVLKVLFGVPLTAEELPLFFKATGRSQPFAAPLTEGWLLVGRRSGKSRTLALAAVCLACFRDYSKYVVAGERVVTMVLATDKDQAQVIFGYARALIQSTPMLASLVERETADSIDLTTGVSIEVHTSSYKSVRGRTLCAALADEIAFWRDDLSRDPASAVLAALRPALATIPGSVLLAASSTYARSGALYDAYARHWGRDASPVLIWKAGTLEMNPSFNAEVIESAREQDAQSAAAEYFSEFRTDVSSFLADSDIEAAIVRDRRSLPMSLQYAYHAFADLSGGRNDSAAISIAHREAGGRVVVDRIDTVAAPFNPEEVIARFAAVLSSYGLNRVCGDNYSAEFVVSAFARHGIGYVPADLSKGDIYCEVLPLFTAQLVELVDQPQLEGELRQLERRPRAGGRDSIDHPRGGHDDVANAAMGSLWLAARQGSELRGEIASSITQALRNYDVLADRYSGSFGQREFAGSSHRHDYSHASSEYDPIN